jgi:hypothetical protein
MPKGLKATSSQLVVSFGLSETTPNTPIQQRVDLQLNALDNEVFVILGVKMDLSAPTLDSAVAAGVEQRRRAFASLSKQDISSSAQGFGLQNPSVFATAENSNATVVTAIGANDVGFTQVLQENSIDTPFEMEYLDIIATPDFFVTVVGTNNDRVMGVEGKLYGYRARADAATYAALVQSELLSQ